MSNCSESANLVLARIGVELASLGDLLAATEADMLPLMGTPTPMSMQNIDLVRQELAQLSKLLSVICAPGTIEGHLPSRLFDGLACLGALHARITGKVPQSYDTSIEMF